MKRTEVTIEEHRSGNVTEKAASVDEIRGGEGFICVDRPPERLAQDHKWPVWERVENGLFRNRKNDEIRSYVPSSHDSFRVKE